jgi:hypothetical protein
MATQAEASFSTHLAQFLQTTERLNEASQNLNAILKRVEKSIVDANCGIEVWLEQPLSTTDSTGSPSRSMWNADVLGFAKLEGTWCLAIKTLRHETGFFEGDPDCPYHEVHAVGDVMPLTQASRDLRIEALRLLPALIDQLTVVANDRIKTISEAKRLFEK